MVPNGWEKTDLTNLINIKHGFAFKSEYFREIGEYILLTPGSFYEKGGFKDQKDKTKYYIGEIPDSYLLTKNDLLIAMTEQASGLLGSALFVPEKSTYLHNQRLGKVEIKAKERIDLNFLYLTFNSPPARKQISEQSTGTKVKHTSPDKLKSIICLLPPLPEQQKIAKILSTWDKAISTTERLIENSTQQKKALMQQLLTSKKRLLDESGERFKGEWEEVKLGKVSDVRDGTHDSPEFIDVGYPLITSKNLLSSGRLDLSNVKFISEEDYLQINKRSGVNDGDILFGMIGTIGNPVKVKSSNYAIKNVALIKETGGLLNGFLIYYLSSHDIDKQIHRLNAGGTQKFVALGVLRNLVIRLPTQQEQQKIATVLINADKEIDLLEQQLADLQQEKKALMQVLLTGKKRVKLND